MKNSMTTFQNIYKLLRSTMYYKQQLDYERFRRYWVSFLSTYLLSIVSPITWKSQGKSPAAIHPLGFQGLHRPGAPENQIHGSDWFQKRPDERICDQHKEYCIYTLFRVSAHGGLCRKWKPSGRGGAQNETGIGEAGNAERRRNWRGQVEIVVYNETVYITLKIDLHIFKGPARQLVARTATFRTSRSRFLKTLNTRIGKSRPV